MNEKTRDHSELSSLFNQDGPNHPIMFAGLEGRIKSTVITDDEENPTSAVIRTPEGLTFFSPSADQAFVRGSLRKLQFIGPVMAVVVDAPQLLPKPDVVIPRFQFKRFKQDQAAEKAGMPTGISILPMDEKLMVNCEWRSLIELSYGTIHAYLDSAFGFCLVDGDQIVTEVYAAFIGRGAVEIGVITSEAFRNKGYGTLASAYLIEQVKKQGLEPYWSCDQSNAGSVALARKLGFTEICEYSIQGYRPLKTGELNT